MVVGSNPNGIILKNTFLGEESSWREKMNPLFECIFPLVILTMVRGSA